MAATNIALFRGNKAGKISLSWNYNHSETDGNVICSNTDSNDDQQNTARQDDNTNRMPKRHNKHPVKRNGDFFGKKIII
jgi:hypothetical protein